MIWFLLILGVLPGAVGFAVYPRLTSRGTAWLIAFGAAAGLAALLAATARFWWLPDGANTVVSSVIVLLAMGVIAGTLIMALIVGMFGGPDAVTPRPLNRIVATGATVILSLLICQWLIDIQRGIG